MPKNNQTASTVKHLEKEVKSIKKTVARNKPDLKYFTTETDSYALDNAGFIINAFQNSGVATFIQQGTGELNRLGDGLRPHTINIRYNAHCSATSDLTNTIRVILLKDKSSGGLFPALGDILDLTGVTPGSEVYAHFNQDNKARFKILMDKTHCLSFNGPANIVGHKIKKVFGKTTFQGNTGNVSDLANNQHWLVAISDSTVATHPTWTHNLQTSYLDN